MDFLKMSAEAWNHAKEVAGITEDDISYAAGWVFESGPQTGKPTQMEWFVANGRFFPSIPSLLRISQTNKKFVDTYISGATFLVGEKE